MARTRRHDRPPTASETSRILRARLAERGLKWSKQRHVIAETFFAAGGHLSVDELLAAARKRDPQVSLATVYRTVKLLADIGLAREHQFGDRQARYERGGLLSAHHDHFVCTSCDRIIEFVEPRIATLQGEVAAREGFEVTAHELELYGRCADCRKKRPGPAS